MAFTQKQLDDLLKNAGKGVKVISEDSLRKNPASKPAETPKRSKFGAIPQVDVEDGSKIDSKLEAKHRAEYRQMLRDGKLIAYSRQPEFVLTGGIKYVADHLLIHLDGSMTVVDSKGIETPEFKMKMKLMRECHPDILVQVRGASAKKRASKKT